MVVGCCFVQHYIILLSYHCPEIAGILLGLHFNSSKFKHQIYLTGKQVSKLFIHDFKKEKISI